MAKVLVGTGGGTTPPASVGIGNLPPSVMTGRATKPTVDVPGGAPESAGGAALVSAPGGAAVVATVGGGAVASAGLGSVFAPRSHPRRASKARARSGFFSRQAIGSPAYTPFEDVAPSLVVADRLNLHLFGGFEALGLA